MLKARRAILQAKNESSYSVDPTLTAADNSILARNLRVRTIQQELDERRPARPWFGSAGKAVSKTARVVSFDVEVAGSGAAGTAPGVGPLLKACGMSETVTPATSVAYTPISTGESSAYLKFFNDGKLYAAPGARGNVVVRFDRGRVPLFQFNFLSLYLIPADVAIPAPTLTLFQTPLAMNKDNTPTTSVHGTAVKMGALELDAGNVVFHNNKPQSEAILLLDRLTRGRVSFEEELVATKDWYSIVKAGTAGALSVVHGTAAGNIVTIGAPAIQLEDVDKAEEDMIAMENVPFNCRPGSSGSDEFSITFT